MIYVIEQSRFFKGSVSTDTASEPVRLPSLGDFPAEDSGRYIDGPNLAENVHAVL